MWQIKRRRRKRVSTVTKHYQAHKELARAVIHDRLLHYNQHYKLTYNRVSIKNQRRCWGSCSSLKNLNFSYKLLFLPPCLRDYVIVHELCHLKEMHHGAAFWDLVAECIPDYKERIRELRGIERQSIAASHLERVVAAHSQRHCTFCARE